MSVPRWYLIVYCAYSRRSLTGEQVIDDNKKRESNRKGAWGTKSLTGFELSPHYIGMAIQRIRLLQKAMRFISQRPDIALGNDFR